MSRDTSGEGDSPMELDGDIAKTLKTLYGFNLGFALEGDIEENAKNICAKVVDTLHDSSSHTSREETRARVAQNLTIGGLQDIAELYSEYKAAVVSRLENSGSFSEL